MACEFQRLTLFILDASESSWLIDDVVHTVLEMNWFDFIADVRLNPALERNCREDIDKLCEAEFHQLKPGKESGGKVLLCLRRNYVKKVVLVLH